MAYCYRHPNRETFVSCSECGTDFEIITVNPIELKTVDDDELDEEEEEEETEEEEN